VKNPRAIEIIVPSFDGTSLHVRYSKLASATKVPFILNDGLGCSGYAWKHIIPALRREHPIIEWHYRGHGKSEVPQNIGTMTMECLAKDLISVLDTLKVDSAVAVSHSMGVQVALEAHSHFPERFAAHVLVCGGYKHPIATWHMAPSREKRHTYSNFGMRELFPRVTRALIAYPKALQVLWEKLVVSELAYQSARFLEVNHRRVNREDFYPYFAGLGTMQASVFAHIARSYSAHTAESVLSTILCPTLIIGGGQDTFCPGWIIEDMHQMVKDSDLLMIPDGSHATPIEHPELINLRIEKFLRERVLRLAPNRARKPRSQQRINR
jgi:pimeloyl-ACP methyl ester carboxylesterase